MHVGYVLKKFPRISETFILNEILELERQGVEVTVLSLHRPDDGRFHADLARLHRPVVYLPQLKSVALLALLRANLPLLRASGTNVHAETTALLETDRGDVWTVLAWGFQVALQVRAQGIDRLHAHFATVATHVARAARAFCGVPYSFTCHAKDIYRDTVTPSGFRALAGPADFVVTVCEANRDHLRRHLLDGTPTEAVRVYNGVDLDLFHPRDRCEDTPPLLLGVGRLVEKKGFTYLVEAASRLLRAGLDLRCCIVGDGEEQERLAAQIDACAGDRRTGIELAGSRTHDEVRALLHRASILVLPCVIGTDGNRDALPTVLLEALACGVPVVSTPVAGVAEIVGEGRAGLLVPCGDAAALERALGDLLEDPDRRRGLAHEGRRRAESLFDLRANVGSLRALLERGPSRAEPG